MCAACLVNIWCEISLLIVNTHEVYSIRYPFPPPLVKDHILSLKRDEFFFISFFNSDKIGPPWVTSHLGLKPFEADIKVCVCA